MVRASRSNPRPRRAGHADGVTQASDQARQNAAHFPPSGAAAAPDIGGDGRKLHDRRMTASAGSPRGVRRSQRRRPEQTDKECQWQQALAWEIHEF